MAKVAVQWLIERSCFVSSSVVADSFALRNRHLIGPGCVPIGPGVCPYCTEAVSL
jgi:hypothetical protein